MFSYTSSILRTFALTAVLACVGTPVFANNLCATMFLGALGGTHRPGLQVDTEDSNGTRGQIDLYLTNTVEKSSFIVGRGFSAYLTDFSNTVFQNGEPVQYRLEDSLSKLNSRSNILDLGAGLLRFADQYTTEGLAVLARIYDGKYGNYYFEDTKLGQALRQHGPAHVTAVTMADLNQAHNVYNGETWKTLEQHQKNPKITALFGRYFEEIPNPELTGKHGSFDLVTDNFGVFAYSLNMGLVIEKVASVMKPGGELWLRGSAGGSFVVQGEQMSGAKFLVRTGLFEAVNFSLDDQHTGDKLLFRRTNRPSYKIETVISTFEKRPSQPIPSRTFTLISSLPVN